MMELTQENYYQDTSYLTNSRFKRYMECEAKAHALDAGEWAEERDETALLLGNYVHSFFESSEAHEQFLAENGSKLLSRSGKTKGQLKKEFVIGDKMIAALKNDDKFVSLYEGFPDDEIVKEMIVHGEIEGVPVKGKLDMVSLNRGYFVDLKTMRSIYSEEWNADLKKRVPMAVNNILGFGYHGQLALYAELLRQMTGKSFKSIIVAVSKEDVPDKEFIKVDDGWLEEGLEYFKDNVKHVWQVIQGEVKPKLCGRCDYCRSKKKLGRVVTLEELIDG